MKGAHGIGIEIEPHAAEMAVKNAQLNHITTFDVVAGGLEVLSAKGFDAILANINKNVLEESVSALVSMMHPGGHFLCSGFLSEDAVHIEATFAECGLKKINQRTLDKWSMLHFDLPL